jgi:hypothetical protein
MLNIGDLVKVAGSNTLGLVVAIDAYEWVKVEWDRESHWYSSGELNHFIVVS